MFFISQNAGIFVIWVMSVMFSTHCHSRIMFYDPHLPYYYDPNIPDESHGTFANAGWSYSETLKFGLPLPLAPKRFEGMAVLANPEDGCRPIVSPPNATGINRTGKWIALMKTGNCDYTVKARNAQNANYHMALIYGIEKFENIPDVVDMKVYRSSNKSSIKMHEFSTSDPDNKTEITLHFNNENITVPHAITVQTQFSKSSNNSDIKIYALITPLHDGNRIINGATYKDNITLGIVDDDFDRINCIDERESITCFRRTSKTFVPAPDTWAVS